MTYTPNHLENPEDSNHDAIPHKTALGHIHVLAGPWCAQNLANLDADVIKVERPGAGDDACSWRPPI